MGSDNDLNSLARTLAERVSEIFACGHVFEFQVNQAEEVIREAIEKTIEAPILREAINDISHVSTCDMQYIDGELDPDNCQRCLLEHAIRSLKQSNAVAEDEGPCADCGRPKSDSAMHLDSPSNAAPQPLHWFRQSNSGRAEQGIVRE